MPWICYGNLEAMGEESNFMRFKDGLLQQKSLQWLDTVIDKLCEDLVSPRDMGLFLHIKTREVRKLYLEGGNEDGSKGI